MSIIIKYLYLLGITLLVYEVTAFSDNVTIDEIPDSSSSSSSSRSFKTEKSLWASLMENCKNPTLICVEQTMYNYMQNTLETARDVELTSFWRFSRNSNDYNQIDHTHNDSDDIVLEEDYDNPLSSVEKMSRSFHDKTVKFLMTHDTEVELPEMIFEGTTLKLSPRSFAGEGVLIQMEFIPREIRHGLVEARLFKKIKKFITDKLLYALLAILLVIKLLSIKFLFLMPMMMGVAAAKKLLLKVLLFLFPALHHLFKLCPYVPHGTKFHHHKHHIAHLHHVPPFVQKHPAFHGPKFHGPGHSIEVIAPHAHGPPSLHHFNKHEPPHKPFFQPHEQELDYHTGGPHLSHTFISHRQDPEDTEKDDTWGEGQDTNNKNKINNKPLTPTEIENSLLAAEREALLKTRLQKERLRIQQENIILQEQLKQAIRLQEKLKLQTANINSKFSQQTTHLNKVDNTISTPSHYLQTPLTSKQSAISQQQQQQGQWYSVSKDPPKYSQQIPQQQALQQTNYDTFYSPILEKIDKILVGLGFNDEPCRERLICSMYKNPTKFSPHSNLLSAELSRDSNELQKPTSSNAPVVRFYRYVQAARDGQDKRDCLRLYTACSINTEQK